MFSDKRPIEDVIAEAANSDQRVNNGLLAVLVLKGELPVRFFLDQVPQKGQDLWDRFIQSGHSTFSSFYDGVLQENMHRALFPRNCRLDLRNRNALFIQVSSALVSAGARTPADILGPYSEEGSLYAAAKSVSCKGCHVVECQHYVPVGGC